MWLILAHPAVASRSCGDCTQKSYNEDGTPTMRAGIHWPRPAGQPTPCWKCPKVPKGARPVRESALELDERLWRAWSHYRECRAVGQFPDDPIVRWCASTIREVEDAADRNHLVETFALILGGSKKHG